MRERIITEIEQRMLPHLDNKQLELLHTAISEALDFVGFESNDDSAENELVQNTELVEKFLSSKRLEGCSEKTLIYTIRGLSQTETEYINMLMLDRVERYMGFADWQKIKSSVERYIEFHKEIGMIPPINYKPLIDTNGKPSQ